jgi:hypothetical protein
METKDPNGGRQYDDREIDARAIVRYAGGLAVLTAAALGLTWVFSESLSQTEHEAHTAPAAIATELPTSPPEPRLQPQPPAGLKALRSHEDEILGSYHWVDADRGIAAIPVADAIELLARRGLPSRPTPPEASTVTVPTRSSPQPQGGDR